MRTSIFIGLLVACCVLVSVGPAAADSDLFYPDGTDSQAIDLGTAIAFILYDNPGDGDIFVHPVNFFADLQFVSLSGAFTGYGIWLNFVGFTPAGRPRYEVHMCQGSQFSCSFFFQGFLTL